VSGALPRTSLPWLHPKLYRLVGSSHRTRASSGRAYNISKTLSLNTLSIYESLQSAQDIRLSLG
jgi:hypothetical protein